MIMHEINDELDFLGVSSITGPACGFHCSNTTSLGIAVIYTPGYEWHCNAKKLLEKLTHAVVEEVSLYGAGRTRLISIFRDCELSAIEF